VCLSPPRRKGGKGDTARGFTYCSYRLSLVYYYFWDGGRRQIGLGGGDNLRL